jgi:hypothetical protein
LASRRETADPLRVHTARTAQGGRRPKATAWINPDEKRATPAATDLAARL